MGVAFKDSLAGPHLVPVPQLDQHVIAACENQGLNGVDCDASDVVCVGLKRVNLLQCVVVEGADL